MPYVTNEGYLRKVAIPGAVPNSPWEKLSTSLGKRLKIDERGKNSNYPREVSLICESTRVA
jgi:hypothetical protein